MMSAGTALENDLGIVLVTALENGIEKVPGIIFGKGTGEERPTEASSRALEGAVALGNVLGTVLEIEISSQVVVVVVVVPGDQVAN